MLSLYTFIHDYNYKVFGGIRESVRKIEVVIGKKINKVTICDYDGILIMTK